VQGISDIITIPGVINRDFADVKTTMAGMGYAVMGTAMRSGADRAVEAAMAAMASPLLEAGAIDGARGILINITGSSSLKLSEVNEASSIIQNAAHEDANIIFGAVLDETMGDEVKITVIATGFKQQEMPQRRERMLAEATLPTMRYDVPIQPRVLTQRTEAPRSEAPRSEVPRPEVPRSEALRFASEPAPEPPAAPVVPVPLAPVVEAKEQVKVAAEIVQPELLPVAASVFDDDFFRYSAPRRDVGDESAEANRVEMTPPDRFREPVRELIKEPTREPTHLSTPVRVQHDDARMVTDAPLAGETLARSASFGGAATDQTERDELDIPAFLRRGK
jgi:cell division protein FtsZ